MHFDKDIKFNFKLACFSLVYFKPYITKIYTCCEYILFIIIHNYTHYKYLSE